MSELNISEAVTVAIMRERSRRNVSTDEELAKQLGILPKHLSRWRNGHFTRLDRILAELIIRAHKSTSTSS